jgi:tRNA/tmRNA/rRNA uracil-C5-methylase (TrmA/RlmC/RlmD family)
MRSYNYVIVPTHDFDQVVYKIRAIDFDQQSFEGKLSVYRPQFFKENNPIMELVRTKLNHNSINQYKIEERSIVARRIITSGNRLKTLISIMRNEVLTLPENLERLKQEIYKFTNDKAFLESKSMGDIMKAALNFVRQHYENVDMHKLF